MTADLAREPLRPVDSPAPAEARPRREAAVRPRWVRPSAAALLVATGLLYLWNLTNSGYANSFYAAAVQAGSKDWTAWLFGSLDAGNAITVDKPPAALWIPGLLGRIFGFSSFTLLLPQAFMGVAAVALLYAAVRRVSGPAAGLMAGAALAATPVAALMFRFDNPDAMLTLLVVLAGYLTVRAIEKAGWRWLAAAGAVIGLAFLTKMLQGFIVVPALALAYVWAAPTSLGRRLAHLGAALAGIVAVAGTYVLAFELTPASARPYMAGSQTNSFLELTFGYNGLRRIFGGADFARGAADSAGSGADFARGAAAGPGSAVGPGSAMDPGSAGDFGGLGAHGGFGGSPGLTRMFGPAFGLEISWLLPAALILLVAGLWFTRRAPRTDRVRASLVLWGGWTLLTAAVFSFMSGTIHSYYSIELAPGIAALVGIGAAELWRARTGWPARATLAAVVLAAGIWSGILLSREETWLPWLKVVVITLGVLAAVGLLARFDRLRLGAVAIAVSALLAGGLGSAAYAVATASVGHTGSSPASGPTGASGMGAMGARAGMADGGTRPDAGSAERGGGEPGGFGGGFGGETASNPELNALLASTTTKWSAIVTGAPSAASLELATGTSVIALGGFGGADPYPTLEGFKQMVADGQIGYFIAGGGLGGGGMRGETGRGNSEIAGYVAAKYEPIMVGGATVYRLEG